MATNEKKEKDQLIDPIYQKFTKSVIRAIGSTEFYEYFMRSIEGADNQFQFSNRKLEKVVDLSWVDAIEATLPAFQSIIAAPRNIIQEDEVIVNVANAKKAGADVVRHLAQHASMVEKFDPETGDVRPSKLMQKYREDSIGAYENRLVFTALETAYHFVKIRHDAITSVMSEEFGAKLKVSSSMESDAEQVQMELFLQIKETDSIIDTDDKNSESFSRISRIYRVLSVMMNSQFAQQLASLPAVKGAITKTNVLKKNPTYRKVTALLEYLRNYQDIGYTVRVIEQNPQIDENFQRDIYHNILFNYLILKGYLEDEKDRRVQAPLKERKRTLKPKFIKQIIEELTEDYDLPDVEIRKVLIEELTKEQLMQEEQSERLRLVEEQEERRRREQEQLRLEQEAQRKRLQEEKEAEEERVQLEREAEEKRQQQARILQETEDRKRCKAFQEEAERFQKNLEDRLRARAEDLKKQREQQQAFEEAQRLLEEAEQRKREELERLKQEKEQAAIRREQEAIERQRRLEQERERLRREEEERQRKLILERQLRDEEATRQYQQELTAFFNMLPQQLALRAREAQRQQQEQHQREQERKRRQTARSAVRKY